MNLSVFILAAGLGERLKPITDYIPKPLIPILGKPVLQSILEKVSALPINKIGINICHKKDVLKNWIKNSSFTNNVELFPEDPILGTGGALKNAEAFLKNSIFLVHNSDIISDIDLVKLIEFHNSSKNLATLAVHDYPEFNKLLIDNKGFLKRIEVNKEAKANERLVAFTGIAVYQPEFLEFLPTGTSNVVNAWAKALSGGYKIGIFDVTGCSWSDIGTPVSYAKTVFNELKKIGETVYIHPSVNWCKDIEFDGYIVFEKGSVLYKSVTLRNCILLTDTKIDIRNNESASIDKEGYFFENCILGSGFKINFSESDIFESDNDNVFLIGTGGSDRKYYRVRSHKHPNILMQSPDYDSDFQRHIEYTQFFNKYSIPVPKLIDVDTNKKQAVFEDLGDLTLYSWLKCPRETEEIERIYKQVLDIMVSIHTSLTEHVSECPLLKKRIFDYEYLKWETHYFVERFVDGIKNVRVKNFLALYDEFHHLALKVDSFHKTVIHRDFQSQNIMITKRNIPKIVDYQGARIGPPAYDIASLLWDPYYRLEDTTRERLLNYYIGWMIKNTPWFKENEFRKSLLPCRLQRHMQVLGAYGFLSKVKGKKYFLKHIPEGLRLLKEDISLSKSDYPILSELVMQL